MCDYSNGKIYEMSLDTYKDGSNYIKRERTAQAIHKDNKLIFHNILEIEFEAGVGLIKGQGIDPQAMVKWADDGGHTFGNEHWQSVGKIGEYGIRARWKKLGRSRSRDYRLMVSDPVKWVIIGAYLNYTLGTS